MSKAYEIFKAFEENGDRALEVIRKKSFTPAASKTLRTVIASKVA